MATNREWYPQFLVGALNDVVEKDARLKSGDYSDKELLEWSLRSTTDNIRTAYMALGVSEDIIQRSIASALQGNRVEKC